MRKIIGPDVSFYQDDPNTPNGINFTSMNQVADFVIVRAGQQLYADSDFKENWRKAKETGLPRGSYWFYDSRADPKQQAEAWVALLDGDKGELPLFADIEESYQGAFTGWAHWKNFLERLKELIGSKELGIYTAYAYWLRNAPDPITQPNELEYFHRYPLWIANYGVEQPLVPKPWNASEWVFWQFTAMGDGIAYGAESSQIDLNYFNGDAQAFAKRFNVPVPGDPPPPEPIGKKYLVNTKTLNVREGPGTNFKAVGFLQRNDVVEAFNANSNGSWLQIRRASDGLMGWCSVTYLIRIDTPPPPPPDNPPGTVRYRVTAGALYIREGPASTYKAVGHFIRDDVVEELESNSDGSWKRVRRLSDKLTGWCSVTYLLRITAPPPDDQTGTKYRITTTRLYVREGPGTNFKSLGFVQQNEIVFAIGANANNTWRQIRRSDGLVGWSSARYMTKI
jgi:GH25 family lysozyme M1 (1,4-beta-N-acetylmuramidase)/uncharacterized protein YraI